MEQVKKKWRSCGTAMYFNEVRLVDTNGKEVPNGTPGEITVRSPMLFSGYWNNSEATKEVLRDGWVYTGDIAYRDEDGFYYICGRRKNMFSSFHSV